MQGIRLVGMPPPSQRHEPALRTQQRFRRAGRRARDWTRQLMALSDDPGRTL